MSETTTNTGATTETAGETSAGTTTTEAAATTETAGEQVDWQAKFEAQQKITRDLEKKVKGEAGTLKTQLDALQARLDGKEAEHAAAQERAEADKAILAAANRKIVRSEVKAAAKGVLADPADAHQFLDIDSFDVDDDGNVDEAAIAEAIGDLVKNKPYLAAQGRRFPGSADGGPRNESDVSIDDQIAAAQKAGNFAQVIALKRRKAYADKT